MERILTNFAISFLSWIEFLKKEKQFGLKSVSFKKINLILKGFYSIGQVPFNFSKFDYSDFISDLENIRLSYLNYPYGRLLRDKLLFSIYFKNFCNVPEIYAYLNRGYIHSITNEHPNMNFDLLLKILENNAIITKPRFGTGGKDITKIERKSENEFLLNNQIFSKEKLQNWILTRDDFIIVKYIKQSTFSEKFFDNSANTIRITTYVNPESKEGKILYALMRFGTNRSAPADNVGAGGVYALIDIESGQLGKAIELLDLGKYRHLDIHPESKVPIENVYIPGWGELKNDFIKLSSLLSPYIKFAGWDIILTDDSYYLIEGNNGPDLYIQGPDNPLAISKDIKAFLKNYNIR